MMKTHYCLFLLLPLATACSGPDQAPNAEETADHVLKEYEEATEKARQVEDQLQKGLERTREALEDQEG
ncbi:MAG: hypothetical protein HND55_08225 [Pseudomonadota bacterium]|nr:MAG: hypothetical protein HND55_08225 [Pseudomonadota bacterium]